MWMSPMRLVRLSAAVWLSQGENAAAFVSVEFLGEYGQDGVDGQDGQAGGSLCLDAVMLVYLGGGLGDGEVDRPG